MLRRRLGNAVSKLGGAYFPIQIKTLTVIDPLNGVSKILHATWQTWCRGTCHFHEISMIGHHREHWPNRTHQDGTQKCHIGCKLLGNHWLDATTFSTPRPWNWQGGFGTIQMGAVTADLLWWFIMKKTCGNLLKNLGLGVMNTRLLMAAFHHIGATKTLNAMLIWETWLLLAASKWCGARTITQLITIWIQAMHLLPQSHQRLRDTADAWAGSLLFSSSDEMISRTIASAAFGSLISGLGSFLTCILPRTWFITRSLNSSGSNPSRPLSLRYFSAASINRSVWPFGMV